MLNQIHTVLSADLATIESRYWGVNHAQDLIGLVIPEGAEGVAVYNRDSEDLVIDGQTITQDNYLLITSSPVSVTGNNEVGTLFTNAG